MPCRRAGGVAIVKEGEPAGMYAHGRETKCGVNKGIPCSMIHPSIHTYLST